MSEQQPPSTPPIDEAQRRAELLELKDKVSGLSESEADELSRIPINVGGGAAIFVPRTARSEAEFGEMAREGEKAAQAWQAWDGKAPFRPEDHR